MIMISIVNLESLVLFFCLVFFPHNNIFLLYLGVICVVNKLIIYNLYAIYFSFVYDMLRVGASKEASFLLGFFFWGGRQRISGHLMCIGCIGVFTRCNVELAFHNSNCHKTYGQYRQPKKEKKNTLFAHSCTISVKCQRM